MDVSVDQSGEQRGVAEIDRLCAGRMRDGLADFDDPVALDEDFAGRHEFSGFDVEKASGVEDDRARGLSEGR